MNERKGRTHLLDAAADLFEGASFADVSAGVVSARRVADRAGSSVGTITHHFRAVSDRPSGSLPYEALKWALDRVTSLEGVDPLDEAVAALDDGDPDAVPRLANGLADHLREYSPDDGPATGVTESEEVALFLAAGVAPHDPEAAARAQEFCRPMRRAYEAATERLLDKTRRRYVRGLSGVEFAVITGALCDGFVWLRRFDRAAAPASLFAEAWMRLFEACTVPLEAVETSDYVDLLFKPPPGSQVDPQKRTAIAVAAADVYEEQGWDGLTVRAVAERASVSRPTVAAHFGDRNGLAAAVWARHLPGLQEAIARDEGKPLYEIVRAHLTRLAELASLHRQLTGGLLEGVFAYTLRHGAPTNTDPADPRTFLPLPNVLQAPIRDNATQFRAPHADSPESIRDTAAMLTNFALHTSMTRPGWAPNVVADRICDTTLAGMLKRRPQR